MNNDRSGVAVLLASDAFERAHYGFMLAVSALAIGRPVVMFAGGRGVRAFAGDWSGLAGSDDDARLAQAGVADFETLRSACFEFDGIFLACEAGMRQAGLGAEDLCAPVRVAGMPTFLEAIQGFQVFTL